MKKYDSYKDSGIEWVGVIPKHWEFLNVKYILRENVKDGPHETPSWFEDGIPFLSIDGIVNGEISFEKCRYIDEEQYEKFSKKLVIEPNDIFIGKAASIGKIARVKTNRKFTVWSPIAVVKVKSDYNPIFVEYYFKSDIIQHQIEMFATSNTQKNIAMGDIPKMKFISPPIEEQTTIANYLDQKTSQIDDLIAKKERLIQLIEEERTAIINQAVTKGLDPTVSMKDSGIEWLGEIPAHWEVKQVRYLLLTGNEGIKIGPFGSALKLEFMVSEGYKIYGQENVIKDDFSLGHKFINEEKYQELLNYKISSGDIVITMMGTAGLAKVVPKNIQEGIMDSHLTRIRVDEDKLLNRLFELLLNDSYLIKSQVQFHSKGAIMGGLNSTIIKSFVLPVAPIDEQEEILSFIESKLNSLVKTNMHIKREIELLREYKTALISEVVTGKVDVRNEILN